MTRADLIRANSPIFTGQGKAINEAAGPNVRVLTVANPCNTNCLIARSHAPKVPADRWFAMTRLDQNRAAAQLAKKAGVPVGSVTCMTIWGNHSDTQYPDYKNARIDGKPATEVIPDAAWFTETYIPTVAKRGSAVIKARGASSAASAANAVIDSVRSLHTPTRQGRLVQRGGRLRRQLRHPRRPDLQLPARLQGRQRLVDRPRPADRRRGPQAARRLGRRAGRRARRRQGAARAGSSDPMRVTQPPIGS